MAQVTDIYRGVFKNPLTVPTHFCAFAPLSDENNVAGLGSARELRKTLYGI